MSIAGWLDALHTNLSPAYRLVWIELESCANGDRWWAISIPDLAVRLHLSEDTVARAVQELKRRKILTITRRKRCPSVYRMLREYPTAGNGADHNPIDTPQNAESTEVIWELTPQNPQIRPSELTPQDAESTGIIVPLTQQDAVISDPAGCGDKTPLNPTNCGVNGGELTPQFAESVNPTVSKIQQVPPVRPPKTGADNLFPVFWELYPRKVGRRTAEAAFTAAVNRGTPAADIVAGLRRAQFHHDPRFQPHPTTWLRADRWLDEVDDFDPVLRAIGLSPDDFPRRLQ